MVRSIITKKVIIGPSLIHELGAFADENISKGDVVFIKGGYILPREERYEKAIGDYYWPLTDHYFLSPLKDSSEEEISSIKLDINHSCEPNCGIRGDVTGVAIRDIKIGEEITFDYAMLDNEDYAFNCNCGSKLCRHRITGTDWRLKVLQKRYKKFFAAYLLEKMAR